MKRKYATLIASAAFFIADNAYALGAVSRACQFSTIPENLKGVSVLFFQAVGAPLSVLQLPGLSYQDQQKYWINESLTTDYIETRYYLYSQAQVYGLVNDPMSIYYRNWQYAAGYLSANWTAEKISLQMQSDSRFAMFYHNRGPFYSARAGHPDIAIAMDTVRYEGFVVLGNHHYYDPVSKISGELRPTSARDCNLPDFGLEGKGIFDR